MLLTRVLSALVLAPIAIAAVYVGGWPFALFWAIAAGIVFWEWVALVRKGGGSLWLAGGVIYAGLLLLAPVALRSDPALGMAAIFLLFAVVWTTDIAGYFVGRAIGGPKLAPSISPNKTWSGAIAGVVGSAIIVALGVHLVPQVRAVPLVILAVLLSIVSQGGDLAESALKRRFGSKDAGRIIPGHGGVMDRLDGFWAAAVCAAIIGVVRGGFVQPAAGLLLW
jgi:phosphatidate cytidylyltransferase